MILSTLYYDMLSDWELDAKVPLEDTFADISIRFIYPDYEQFLKFKPKERIKKINEYFVAGLNRLIKLDLFKVYSIEGTKKRPTGVRTRVKVDLLATLDKLNFVRITINAVDNATKIEKVKPTEDEFFCVKMTIAIDVENLKTKKQDFEQRLVLIKAESFEDAYAKIEIKKDEYVMPYLNPDGRLVRWRIASFDDCYKVGVINPKDLNNADGIEVYSKLKTGKRKSFWNGTI